jgi:hypothetical protein
MTTLGLMLALASSAWAGPGGPPAGAPIYNQSNYQPNAQFSVSSGSFKTQVCLGPSCIAAWPVGFLNLTGPVTSVGAVTSIPGPVPNGAIDLSTVTTALAAKLSTTAPVPSVLIDLSTVTAALAGKQASFAGISSSCATGFYWDNTRITNGVTNGGQCLVLPAGGGGGPNTSPWSQNGTSGADVVLVYSTQPVVIASSFTAGGHVGGQQFDGSGAGLTVIPAGQLTGAVPNVSVDLSTVVTALAGKQAAGSYLTTTAPVPNGLIDLSTVTTALASKQATGNYITALTGPVTASGPGSVATTIVGPVPNGAVDLSTVATQITAIGASTQTLFTTMIADFAGVGASTNAIQLAVGSATNTHTTQINALGLSTNTIQLNIGSATNTLNIEINALGSSTNTIQLNVGSATNSLTVQINSLGASTQTIQLNVGSATQTLFTTMINDFSGVGSSTNTIQLNVGSATNTLNAEINALGSSTNTIQLNVGSSTKALNVEIDALGASTNTIQLNVGASTQTLKTYVDSNLNSYQPKASCRLATTAALPTNAYLNGSSGVGATLTGTSLGVLTVDGIAASVGDRIVVKNEANPSHNGLYAVTTNGAGAFYVLTRTVDFNQVSEMAAGVSVLIDTGAVNDNAFFVNATSVTTVGTDSIVFLQVNGLTQVTAGTGIAISANVVSLVTPVSVTNGGTGQATLTANGGLVGNGTGGITSLPQGALASGIPSLDWSNGGAGKSTGTLVAGSNVTLTWAPASGLTIAASGAGLSGGLVPQFPYWTGTTAIGNSTLSQDSANSITVDNSSFTVQGKILGSTATFLQNGVGPQTQYPNAPIVSVGNINSYFQTVVQNQSNGANASGDLVITDDLGSDTSYYMEVGINSSKFSQGNFAVQTASAGFVSTSDSDLYIWSQTNGTAQGAQSGRLVMGAGYSVAMTTGASLIIYPSSGTPGAIVAQTTFTVLASSFSVGGNSLAVIGSSVGVRTASPQAALDVNGQGIIRGNLTTTSGSSVTVGGNIGINTAYGINAGNSTSTMTPCGTIFFIDSTTVFNNAGGNALTNAGSTTAWGSGGAEISTYTYIANTLVNPGDAIFITCAGKASNTLTSPFWWVDDNGKSLGGNSSTSHNFCQESLTSGTNILTCKMTLLSVSKNIYAESTNWGSTAGTYGASASQGNYTFDPTVNHTIQCGGQTANNGGGTLGLTYMKVSKACQ